MLNFLFFAPIALYFIATLLQFLGTAFRKEGLKQAAWYGLLVSLALHTAYLVVRGVKGGRLPLSNQFEFATAFAWGIALMAVVLRIAGKRGMDWVVTAGLPLAFLILSYAAFQAKPDQIAAELMPSLRSSWFALHIGAAVFSYSGFALAAGFSVRYLMKEKKLGTLSANARAEEEAHLEKLDTLSYKLVCFGFLLLTVVILSGCVWAEQAWGSFWTWDPKETWALITWLIYSVLLHNRIRKNWRGKKMAWFCAIAFVCVLFTFAGVNKLLAGLHSYA
ncbi:MAG: c-type cytochrome biogenesis protein CcsB [Clostridia bacterium]|nr:c-type cytochrome biogenesis protein CcsB [Clostridia bacterium]